MRLSQFELIKQGILNSVPRHARFHLTNSSVEHNVNRAVVTLVELANTERTDDRLVAVNRGIQIPYAVSEYSKPSGYNWSEVVNFSGKVAARSNLLKAGRYCLSKVREKYPSNPGFVVADMVMTPAEFEMFWLGIEASDRYFKAGLGEISKAEYTIDRVEGFYDNESNVEDGRMSTIEMNADGVSIYVSEFFLLKAIKSFDDEAVTVLAPSVSEFEAWMRKAKSNNSSQNEDIKS